MLAWNFVPAARNGSVGLRGEQQYGRALAKGIPPESRRNPTGPGPMPPRSCDQLKHQRGQKGDAQRGHGGDPVFVGHLAHTVHLRVCPAESSQGGRPVNHVQEVATEHFAGAPLLFPWHPGLPADQDAERWGSAASVTSTIIALVRSVTAKVTTTARGTVTPRTTEGGTPRNSRRPRQGRARSGWRAHRLVVRPANLVHAGLPRAAGQFAISP